ncbi:20765_t:CDS:2, partial [Rhizophagus irregularis]
KSTFGDLYAAIGVSPTVNMAQKCNIKRTRPRIELRRPLGPPPLWCFK